jgi:hypothetical protein
MASKHSNISAFSIFAGYYKFNRPICSPFSFLVELLMHANYNKRTNIWKFLTPLDSTHFEVFLRILWDFSFFEFKLKFWIWTGWNRSGPVGPVPTVSGPVLTGSVNPPVTAHACICMHVGATTAITPASLVSSSGANFSPWGRTLRRSSTPSHPRTASIRHGTPPIMRGRPIDATVRSFDLRAIRRWWLIGGQFTRPDPPGHQHYVLDRFA